MIKLPLFLLFGTLCFPSDPLVNFVNFFTTWLYDREQLVVDRGGMKEKNIWSMDQFRRMFNSCKLPGEHKDTFTFNFKTGNSGLNRLWCPEGQDKMVKVRVLIPISTF